MKLGNLALMQQQLARALGLVVEAVAVAEFGDIGVDQPDFALAHFGIALRNRALAKAQRLHFGPGQHDPGLEHILDIIVELRPPVLGNDLLLVECCVGRTGHYDRACRVCEAIGEGGNLCAGPDDGPDACFFG